MDRKARRKYFKLFLKLGFTAAALFFVLTEIDLKQAGQLIKQMNLGWFVTAFLLFNLSKIISAFRLQEYFVAISVFLKKSLNLKLYYIGMFYNLFLPGSIGGDGYKVYLINKFYKTSLKDLVAASILDRLSGVVALFVLAGILIFFVPKPTLPYNFNLIIAGCVFLVFPVYYIGHLLLFRKFIPKIWITTYYSFGVQLLQLICAVCLLKALSVEKYYLDYLVLFLVSSVVSVLPITVGGVGARELVFLLGFNYLPIDKTLAVSFSLLFFGITAISSLIGIGFSVNEEDIQLTGGKIKKLGAA